MTQNVLLLRKFNVDQMKCYAFLQCEWKIIAKQFKIHWQFIFKKFVFQNNWANFNQTWHKASLFIETDFPQLKCHYFLIGWMSTSWIWGGYFGIYFCACMKMAWLKLIFWKKKCCSCEWCVQWAFCLYWVFWILRFNLIRRIGIDNNL